MICEKFISRWPLRWSMDSSERNNHDRPGRLCIPPSECNLYVSWYGGIEVSIIPKAQRKTKLHIWHTHSLYTVHIKCTKINAMNVDIKGKLWFRAVLRLVKITFTSTWSQKFLRLNVIFFTFKMNIFVLRDLYL